MLVKWPGRYRGTKNLFSERENAYIQNKTIAFLNFFVSKIKSDKSKFIFGLVALSILFRLAAYLILWVKGQRLTLKSLRFIELINVIRFKK